MIANQRTVNSRPLNVYLLHFVLQHFVMEKTSFIDFRRKQGTGHQLWLFFRDVSTLQVGIISVDGENFIVTGKQKIHLISIYFP